MNKHPNGGPVVGAPQSYQWWLSAIRDSLRGTGKNRLKDYEMVMYTDRLVKAGLKAGVSKEKIQQDFNDCHKGAL